jgi:hypothetical protein
MRSRAIRRSRDPDPEINVELADAIYGDASLERAWHAGWRRLFEPSTDPLIEHQRRMTLSAFVAFAVAIPIWMAGSGPADAILWRVSALGPWVVAIPLLVALIGLLNLRSAVAAAVGPARNVRLAASSFAGGVAAVAVYVLVPVFLGT